MSTNAPSTSSTSAPAAGPDIQSVEQAYAVVFLQDLATNTQMATQWNALLAQLKTSTASAQEKAQAVENFVAGDWGYETTGPDVLDLLQASWWVAYEQSNQANDESRRFVQQVLQDTALYKDYSQALGAAQTAGSLAGVDAWLKSEGFGCTATQVNAAFHEMRDKNLNFWTGIYGQTTMTPAGGTAAAGPALIVYGTTNVSLGAIRIYDVSYGNGVLSWGATSKDGQFDNPCTASLTFSQISMPLTAGAYVGNELDGTLDYGSGSGPYSGKYAFTGRIGEPPANAPGHVVTPPSYNRSAIDDIFKYINYFVMAHMAISALSAIPGALTSAKEWLQSKFGSAAEENLEAAEADVQEVGAESPLDEDQFSEATEISQLEAEDPSDLAEQEQAVEQEEEQAEEADEEEVEGTDAEAEGGGESETEELAEDLAEDV